MIKLEEIKSPDFVKGLSVKELERLAEQIRAFIIENVSETGGHLSSNLGTVELIIALHYVCLLYTSALRFIPRSPWSKPVSRASGS